MTHYRFHAPRRAARNRGRQPAWVSGALLGLSMIVSGPALPAEPAAAPDSSVPPEAVERSLPAPLQAEPAGDRAADPQAECYAQARGDGSDAYVCDLAVQMARSGASGSRNVALAAALNNRALVLAGDGRLEPALADLDAALAETPEDAGLHGNRGNLLLRLGRPADALHAHDRAVELAAEDPVSYYNRAFSYLALGDRGAAERDVATAARLLAGEGDGPDPRLSPPAIPAAGADSGR